MAMPFSGGLRALGPGLPTVTALIAVYNGQEFLGRALDSALGQNYSPKLLDVVVVDDGSTDSSPELLASYESAHPGRITVVRQENAGYVAATATAVANATGQVLAILDADDVWPDDKIGRQVAMLIADPSLGLVYTDTRIIDRYDNVTRESHMRSIGVTPQVGPDALSEIMGKPGNLAISSPFAPSWPAPSSPRPRASRSRTGGSPRTWPRSPRSAFWRACRPATASTATTTCWGPAACAPCVRAA
jgi:hypothetical protein